MTVTGFIFTVLAIIGGFLAWYLVSIFRKMLPEFGFNLGAKLVLISAIYMGISAIAYLLGALGIIGR